MVKRYDYKIFYKKIWIEDLKKLKMAINCNKNSEILNFDLDDSELIADLFYEYDVFRIFRIGKSFVAYFEPSNYIYSELYDNLSDESFYYHFTDFEKVTEVLDQIILDFYKGGLASRYCKRLWSYLPDWMVLEDFYFDLEYRVVMNEITNKILDKFDDYKLFSEAEEELISRWN